MDSNPVLLKSSVFGGFKKKDVLSYIFELNESTQDTHQRLAEQIEELAQSREDYAKKAQELEGKLSQIQASHDGTSASLEQETALNSRLLEQIDKLKNEIAKRDKTTLDKDEMLSRHTAANAELAEKNRVYEEKRAQVELAASQIAGLLGQARDDADRLLAQAKKESALIADAAKNQADKVVDEAQQKASKIIDDAKLEADDLAKASKISAQNYLNDAKSSLDDSYNQFAGFRDEISALSKTVLNAASVMTEKMNALTDSVASAELTAPELPDISQLQTPVLTYEKEEDPQTPQPETSVKVATEVSGLAKDLLGKYGVRKDDSGFFRLAADK